MSAEEPLIRGAGRSPSLVPRSVPFFRQYSALFLKCSLLVLREKKRLTACIVLPGLMVVLLWVLQLATGMKGRSPDDLPVLDSCGSPSLTANIIEGSSGYSNYNTPNAWCTGSMWSSTPRVCTDFPGGKWKTIPYDWSGQYYSGPPVYLHSDLVVNYGLAGLVLVCGPLVVAMIILTTVASEASKHLLGSLRRLGVSEVAYWLSWFTVYALLVATNSVIAAACMKIVGSAVHFYGATSFGPLFALMFFFELSFVAMVLFLASVATHPKLVNALCFLVAAVVLGVVLWLGFDFGSLNSGTEKLFSTMWTPQTTYRCRAGMTQPVLRDTVTGERCFNETSTCLVVGSQCGTNRPETFPPTQAPFIEYSPSPTPRPTRAPADTFAPVSAPTLDPSAVPVECTASVNIAAFAFKNRSYGVCPPGETQQCTRIFESDAFSAKDVIEAYGMQRTFALFFMPIYAPDDSSSSRWSPVSKCTPSSFGTQCINFENPFTKSYRNASWLYDGLYTTNVTSSSVSSGPVAEQWSPFEKNPQMFTSFDYNATKLICLREDPFSYTSFTQDLICETEDQCPSCVVRFCSAPGAGPPDPATTTPTTAPSTSPVTPTAPMAPTVRTSSPTPALAFDRDDTCNLPVVASEYGVAATSLAGMPSAVSDVYVGCYAVAGRIDRLWKATPTNTVALVLLGLLPWFWFARSISVLLSATALPGTSFTNSHVAKSMTQLQASIREKLASNEAVGFVDAAPGSASDPRCAAVDCSDATQAALCPMTCGLGLLPPNPYLFDAPLVAAPCPSPSGMGTLSPTSQTDSLYSNCPSKTLGAQDAAIEAIQSCYDSENPQPQQCFNPDWSAMCPALGESSSDAAFTAPGGEPLSFGGTLGVQVGLTFIYLFLAWYFGQVVQSENGVSQPVWFIFLPSYWGCCGRRGSGSDGTAGKGDEMSKSMHIAMTESRVGGTLRAHNLAKTFGDFEAVKNVTFEMLPGEVFCLLGHNGAGKTTTLNMLTGAISPSAGDAFAFGTSVTEDVNSVRKLIGVCPQEDQLYESLTAREHLRLYATLRGVPPRQVEAEVATALGEVNLSHVADQQSCTYSGGMKRRLSVALSTIGDTRIVLLDEPTTGMDPVNRRFVWRHVARRKEGRVLILTTHSMEEADQLADRVAVIHEGVIKAIGTPIELKKTYGTSLQFNLVVEPAGVDSAVDTIERMFCSGDPSAAPEGLQITSSTAGTVSISIEEDKGVPREKIGAFVSWLQYESERHGVKEWGISNSSLDEVFFTCTETAPGFVSEGDHLETDVSNAVGKPASDLEAGALAKLGSLAVHGHYSARLQIKAVAIKIVTLQWLTKHAWPSWAFLILFLAGAIALYTVVSPPSFSESFATWLLLSLVPLSVFVVVPLPIVVPPIVEERSLGLVNMMRVQSMKTSSYVLAQSGYTFAVQFLFSFILFICIYWTPFFQAKSCTAYVPSSGSGYNYTPAHYTPDGCSEPSFSLTLKVHDRSFKANGAFVTGPFYMLFGIAFVFACAAPGTVLLSSAAFVGPRIASVTMSLVTIGIGAGLPFALIALSDFTEVQKITGMDVQALTNYTAPNQCFQDIADCTLKLQSATSIVEGDIDELYRCAQIFLISPVYCLPLSLALVPQFGFLLMVLAWLLGSFTLYPISEMSSLPQQYQTLLIQAFARIGLFPNGSANSLPIVRDWYNNLLGVSFGGAMVLLVISITAQYVLHFRPDWLVRLGQAARAKLSLRRSVDYDETSDTPVDPDVLEESCTVSHLVDEQRRRREEGVPSEDPLVVQGLRKTYPARGGLPPKVALSGVDLHVQRGQTLALLGPNGAGKTTLIKVIAGSHTATEGNVFVCGYDGEGERGHVFEQLGSCPQFDTVWPQLTVKGHLEFYARLKGVKQVKEAARTMAEGVGLGGLAYERRANALSGGMRRRLSIAIALVGAPSLIIFDEPTTGLDPLTRREIWEVIQLFKDGERGIIVTTHAMEEADALCNRIAIMANGKLKVIGTQQRLKNRFGDGYTLMTSVRSAAIQAQEAATQFLRAAVHPRARLGNAQGNSLRFHLPRDGLDLGKAFVALYSEAAQDKGGIHQWILSQASLEDVFVNVCGEDEAGDLSAIGFKRDGSTKGLVVGADILSATDATHEDRRFYQRP